MKMIIKNMALVKNDEFYENFQTMATQIKIFYSFTTEVI